MGLLLTVQPRTGNEFAIPDHPVANQVFQSVQKSDSTLSRHYCAEFGPEEICAILR